MPTTQLKQVVGYVTDNVKTQLSEIAATNRRLSISQLVEEALVLALPQLQEKYGVFTQPVQVSPSGQHEAA